jgi:3-deoxy-D-manno-octulosonate 8-phosphate phosphatase (KDO 8-P phosphatase)
VLDIDGVMTDGRFGYDGECEIKFFHARDGHGIKMAKRAGLAIGALSGRSSPANRARGRELEFDFLLEAKKNKREAFLELLASFNLKSEECLCIGDDLVDIPIMRMAGVAVTVADAPAEMDRVADFRTTRPGGHGAVREMLEWLLKEQGKWDSLVERYWN